jgi:flavin reductase (DIM6/NTAB) family NADH-FMN oxidoreductase RutF
MTHLKDLERIMTHYTQPPGAFLTVKDKDGRINTMTVCWGFIGEMWSEPHFICVVRPQRHTFGLIQNAVDFTISVPYDGKLTEELQICGTKSGADINKGEVVKFVPAKTTVSPVVDGCNAYYECVINYSDLLRHEFMSDEARSHYNGDTHHFYIGKIVESY